MFKKLTGLLQREQKTVLSAAVLIMASYGLSMLLGLLRERLLVTFFYKCCIEELAAYYAAFRLPDTVFQLLVAGSLAAAFIPIFSRLIDDSKEEAFKVASMVLNGLVVGFVILGLPIFIFAPQLARLITGSFSDYQIQLMANFIRLMLGAQFCFVISSLMTGMIQSFHRFLLPALSPVIYNLGIVLGVVVLSPKLGIYGPVAGVLIGAVGHAGLQVPLVWKLGFRYKWDWQTKNTYFREIGKLMMPRALASGVSQIEATAAVFFATSISSASLVLFLLAQTLMQIPVKLVGVPISQAALPSLAQSSESKREEYRRLLRENILQILYFVLPATAILVILGLPAVRLAYGAESFPWEATKLTRKALAMFVLAIPSQALIQLLIRGFYALKDTRTPLWVGLAGVSSFLGMSYAAVFVLHWGILGLAAATSIASALQVGGLFWLLHKKINLVSQQMVLPVIKLLLATLLMAVSLWVPYRLLDIYVLNTSRVLPLIGLTIMTTSMGLAIYIMLCHGLRIEQQDKILRLVEKLPGTKRSISKLKMLTAVAAGTTSGSGYE